MHEGRMGGKPTVLGDLRNIMALVHRRLYNTDGVFTVGGAAPRRIVIDFETFIAMVGKAFELKTGRIGAKLAPRITYAGAFRKAQGLPGCNTIQGSR